LIYAIVISTILHLLIFSYLLFGQYREKTKAYPRIMTVNLVSLPPISKGIPEGTETPGQPQVKTVKAKPQTKVEQAPESPHLAEVKVKKKPARKKPKVQEVDKEDISKAKKEVDESAKPGIDQDRLGLPEGVELGSEFGTVQLDGASFETPTYLNILFAKIKNRWDNPYLGLDKITCTIYFAILRNGNVIDATVEQSSGIAAFDQSALRAVLSSRPPPLPLEYTGNQLGVHLIFQYLP
jgi:TonB family protein